MRVGIIGGGIMGLTLGQRLSARGLNVTVFEREGRSGGLATYHEYGSFWWDRFYHVILPSDTHLIRYFQEIGLGDLLRWGETRTGLYTNGRFYSLGTALELLRFPLVGLPGKLRLIRTVWECARIQDWERLEGISVEDWLTRMCGRRTYEVFWKPLLLAKLGEHYKRVSAVFIWSYIKRLFALGDATARRRQLGYVSGGYRTVINRLETLIREAGGTIKLETVVRTIRPQPDGGISIQWDGDHRHFDKVIWTGPIDAASPLVGQGLVRVGPSAGPIEYLGVICPVLVTRRPVIPYYTLNIADRNIPFTGVIGMSSVVSTEETAGYYLTYFPKYVLSGDPLLQVPDETIMHQLLSGLKVLFPDLHTHDIVDVQINRASKVQPLQVLHYSKRVPSVASQHEDFFVLNTSQFVNCTLNNNEVIRAVNEFMQDHRIGFQPSPTSPVGALCAASIP